MTIVSAAHEFLGYFAYSYRPNPSSEEFGQNTLATAEKKNENPSRIAIEGDEVQKEY